MIIKEKTSKNSIRSFARNYRATRSRAAHVCSVAAGGIALVSAFFNPKLAILLASIPATHIGLIARDGRDAHRLNKMWDQKVKNIYSNHISKDLPKLENKLDSISAPELKKAEWRSRIHTMKILASEINAKSDFEAKNLLSEIRCLDKELDHYQSNPPSSSL